MRHVRDDTVCKHNDDVGGYFRRYIEENTDRKEEYKQAKPSAKEDHNCPKYHPLEYSMVTD